MNIEQMRFALMHNTKYSISEKWKSRVWCMPDSQVLSMYKRMQKKGLFLSKKNLKKLQN